MFSMVLAPAAPGAQTGPRDQDETPSLELLEFLGFWETPSGELIDPLNLQRPERPASPDEKAAPQENDKVDTHE